MKWHCVVFIAFNAYCSSLYGQYSAHNTTFLLLQSKISIGKPTQKLLANTFIPLSSRPPNTIPPFALPCWSANELPIFCKIEHEIGKKLPIMVKFRLGSVEYVDWLEGK